MTTAKPVARDLRIGNSTAEFLIFTRQAGEESIQVRLEGKTIGRTHKLMAEPFAVDVRTISERLKNVIESNELDASSVIRRFRITSADSTTYRWIQEAEYESDFDRVMKARWLATDAEDLAVLEQAERQLEGKGQAE